MRLSSIEITHLIVPFLHPYSPYDPRGGVFDGPSVTDNGFWDTFRTGECTLTIESDTGLAVMRH